MSLCNWSADVEKLPFEAFTLLEECQLSWMIESRMRREFGLLFRAKPHVAWYVKRKCPAKAAWVDAVLAECAGEPELSRDELRENEAKAVGAYEDWFVYVTEPDAYQRQSFVGWDERELTDMCDYAGKRVVDVGSGTGKQAFAVAPLCRAVYCVEPVANLRKYLRERAAREGVQNIYVTDGILTRLPFEDGFADALTAGHVFGDEPEAELNEMLRVVKPGGFILLIPGNVDRDNAEHAFLTEHGFHWSHFDEPGDGLKRKYWRFA